MEKIQTLTPADIDSYLQQLRKEEHADATIEKYCRDIRSFAAWLDGRPLTKEHTAEWKALLIEQGHASATVNVKLSAVNGLLRFLGREECTVRFLKVQRRVFRDASRELTQLEYERLVKTANRQGRPGMALLLEAICSSGIRVSEVRYLTVEAAKAGKADVYLKGKIRTILLPQKLCRKLLRYARAKKIAAGEIFLTKGGSRMTRYQIWRAMKKLCSAAGVEASKVFPHNLRHLFAVTYYRACKDIVTLADLMGHSSINTTRIYLITTGEEHARKLEKLGLLC